MNVQMRVPPPPLSEFVEVLWICECGPEPHPRERLLPTGTMELVIDLHEETMRVYDSDDTNRCRQFRGPLVCGAQTGSFVIDTPQQRSIVGVHFKPGGAFPFFPLPSDELRDTHVPLDALWGHDGRGLREQLLEAGTARTRFRVLEEALLARGRKRLGRHPAVAFALKEFQTVPHRCRVADVTEQIGLSQRRFIQVFKEAVGLTPKQYCRIRRFQEVIRTVGRRPAIEWTDVALQCGYFDQAHFIHDFRAFSGFSPSAWLARRGDHPNHVPLSD